MDEVKKFNPFDHVNSLSFTKKYTMNDETRSQYIPFVINRAFSNHEDTVMVASAMNQTSTKLPVEMQYDFYYDMVPKRKRYGWSKRDATDVEYAIARFLNISKSLAKEYKSLFSKDELDTIIEHVKESENKNEY